MKINSKWIIGGLIVILGALSTNVYINSREIKNNLNELKLANQRADSIKARENTAYIKIDSISSELSKSSKNLVSLEAKNEELKKQLSYSKIQTSSLSNQVKLAKINKDSTAYIKACDELSEKVDTLIAKSTQDSIQTAGIIKEYKIQVEGRDSLLAERQKLYSALRSDYDATLSSYNNLGKDYKEQSKQIKKAKNQNKILKIAGLALAVFVIAK